MIPKILTYFTILLSFLSQATAILDNFWVISSGVGCTGTIASYSTGFNANIYTFGVGQALSNLDDSWMANSYTTNSIIDSTTGVTEPNINIGPIAIAAAINGL
ncbi:hypothetical protein C6P40_003998 [Pichia californica]|uniref:Uncharacterized protein n=1 Tax=Pichia californica TaxID=460514 RepID=A0A9P6WG35_9ASCO|nr:hypothetical protein C6P40_003998 [[Candida] californica]